MKLISSFVGGFVNTGGQGGNGGHGGAAHVQFGNGAGNGASNGGSTAGDVILPDPSRHKPRAPRRAGRPWRDDTDGTGQVGGAGTGKCLLFWIHDTDFQTQPYFSGIQNVGGQGGHGGNGGDAIVQWGNGGGNGEVQDPSRHKPRHPRRAGRPWRDETDGSSQPGFGAGNGK